MLIYAASLFLFFKSPRPKGSMILFLSQCYFGKLHSAAVLHKLINKQCAAYILTHKSYNMLFFPTDKQALSLMELDAAAVWLHEQDP